MVGSQQGRGTIKVGVSLHNMWLDNGDINFIVQIHKIEKRFRIIVVEPGGKNIWRNALTLSIISCIMIIRVIPLSKMSAPIGIDHQVWFLIVGLFKCHTYCRTVFVPIDCYVNLGFCSIAVKIKFLTDFNSTVKDNVNFLYILLGTVHMSACMFNCSPCLGSCTLFKILNFNSINEYISVFDIFMSRHKWLWTSNYIHCPCCGLVDETYSVCQSVTLCLWLNVWLRSISCKVHML